MMIFICFTSRLYGVLSIWHYMIRHFVYMLITGKITEENLNSLIMNQILALHGILLTSLQIMKMDVPLNLIVLNVMDGKN